MRATNYLTSCFAYFKTIFGDKKREQPVAYTGNRHVIYCTNSGVLLFDAQTEDV